METKKAIILLAATVALLGIFYLVVSSFVQGTGVQIEEVEVPAVEEGIVTVDIAYWGEYKAAANESLMCSNETMDSSLTFFVEATTAIDAVSYEECYIKNNGEQINSTIIEQYNNYVATFSSAETDRENKVQACCVFEGTEYCSEDFKMYQCI